MNDVVYVKLIQQRVAVLGNRRGEDDHLVKLSDSFHECINARAFDDIDVVVLPFDLDRDGEISLVQNLRVLEFANLDTEVKLTLKLLCTKVSSRSRTKHFLPLCSGRMAGRSHFWGSADSGCVISGIGGGTAEASGDTCVRICDESGGLVLAASTTPWPVAGASLMAMSASRCSWSAVRSSVGPAPSLCSTAAAAAIAAPVAPAPVARAAGATLPAVFAEGSLVDDGTAPPATSSLGASLAELFTALGPLGESCIFGAVPAFMSAYGVPAT